MPTGKIERPAENWLDRAIGYVSPRRQFERSRSRYATQLLASAHYDAAQATRRTQGWKQPTGDANAPSALSLTRLRNTSRHLVRNNGHATSALQTIIDDTVGWGIMASAKHEPWKLWTTSTAIDADGRCDLPGLEQLVMRTVVEAGECLVRRRFRRLSDGLPIPLQLQVLEPDFLDYTRHKNLPNGGRIIRGVEFDALGKRAAYWLFREHPGTTIVTGSRFQPSVRVPASEILHVYKSERPGQVRGVPWFAPVLVRFQDFDELADATLMKQKIAACLSVITSDIDGTTQALGTEDTNDAEVDLLEPGLIMNLAPGRDVQVVNPPSVREYPEYSRTTLREIAAGLGVTYEDATGDYTNLPFSAARMSRLRHWARVNGWRWRMMVPQFLSPMFVWADQASQLAGTGPIGDTFWTAPPLPMIEPDKEGLAIQRNIRTGIMTRSEALRERGYVPEEFDDEHEEDLANQDRRGFVFDSDARKMTQAGQLHKDTEGAEGEPPRLSASKLLESMGINVPDNGGGQVDDAGAAT